jgi:serine/threonine protein kinase
MSALEALQASRAACATVIVDWKPQGVRHLLAFTSSNFIGLMEDGCSVLKYPYYPNDRESMHALREEASHYRYLGRHDHLVTFKDMSDDGLVLEYCEQGALCDVLDNLHVVLNRNQKIAIAEQIARGLVYLHSRHYIHGDLNAQNVFVTSDGTAKIGDLQGQLNDSDGNVMIAATAENNAKSRLPGPGPDDDFSTQTDVFAFGTLLYHVWYGYPPYPELDAFRDGDEVQARYRRGEFPVDAHAAAAVGMERVIWRCWTSTYASASEVLEDIISLNTS